MSVTGAGMTGSFGQLGRLLASSSVAARRSSGPHGAEKLLTARCKLLEGIAKGRALDQTLAAVVRLVEREVRGASAVVHLLPAGEDALQLSAGFDHHPEARAALARCPLGPAGGPIGAVAAHGHATVVSDTASHPIWAGSHTLATSIGARSAWLVPIVDDGRRVVGVLSVFWPRPAVPAAAHRRLVAMCTKVIAVAVNRHAVDIALGDQAMRDAVTSLPSRSLFLDRVEHALARAARRGSRVAVLAVNLDRFQVINDSMGYDAGDRILATIAGRLSSATRPGDTVSRLEGHAFMVLCEELATVEEAEAIAERLAEEVRKPVAVDDGELVVTGSIGIAVAGAVEGNRSPRERTVELLRDAGAAADEATHAGPDRRVVFDPGRRTEAVQRLERERQLRLALQRGELWVAYQSIVDLRSGHITAVEALARWDHPELGPVPPTEFIALAEETGLIDPIGDLVLHEALAQVARWRRRPGCAGLVASVNLSVRQLANPDFAFKVQEALARTGVDAAALSLEITESILIDDSETFVEGLRRLKALGVGLTVDDFGTGYSSLTYLKRFPVDGLKIDHSFVAGLGRAAEDDAIVGATVDLGHALGLTVVAEGVETASQVRALLDLGCDRAQGFLFSRPKPASAIDARLGRRATSSPALTAPASAARSAG